MTSKTSLRSVAKSSVPTTSLSAPSVSVRSCGCARRFVPTLPQHSQSAPARRRSRSSTGSSSKSPRSPSAVSSGRNTPSPSPMPHSRLKYKARSESHLADLASEGPRTNENTKSEQLPVYFSTTLFIRLDTNRQHVLEQVKYEVSHTFKTNSEVKYGAGHLQDEQNFSCQPQQFRTELEIHLENQCPVETSSNQT